MSDRTHVNEPGWTLPPRREISPDNLHISSFVIARKSATGEGANYILLEKAGEKHPLSFRRGKWLIPATILVYGEKPREGARQVIRNFVADPSKLADPEFYKMQTYLGAHWDIVFLFNTSCTSKESDVKPKEPFVEAKFFDVRKLPRDEIAADHLEVIDRMLDPSDQD
jgi:hypothetical protein